MFGAHCNNILAQLTMFSKYLSTSLLKRTVTQNSTGFTLIEALITISVLGVLTAIAAPNIMAMGSRPLPDSTNRLVGQIRLARAKAISQTSAFRLRPEVINMSDPNLNNRQTRWVVQRANSCNSTTWTNDASFTEEDVTTSKRVELIQSKLNGVVIEDTDSQRIPKMTFCINSRGTIAESKNLEFKLQYRQGSAGPTQRIEIFPGGSVQIYDIQ
jgi:prepilin-type N-terminal cleavage/methylation domain-containing protein